MRHRRVLLASFVLVVAGCTLPRRAGLFARTPMAARPIAGNTVAVLPPVTVGNEAAPAMVAARASALVFSGDIAGVHFAALQPTVAKLQEKPDIFPAITRAVASGLPSGFGPAGATTKIFDSNMVAGVKRERRQIITLRQITQSQPLGPARLDAELLAPLGCDYALVSVPFGAYEQQSHIGALYGAIPLAGSKQLISLTPRGVYLLYDCKSGEKVWESAIGALPVAREAITMGDRSLPVLGAAYLLTGDIETPLGRLLDGGFGTDRAR